MQAEPASDGELALAHTPAYIQGISDGSVDPQILREIGFPWSPAMAERARRSVGATIAACRAAFAGGVAANIAGGTHHAMPTGRRLLRLQRRGRGVPADAGRARPPRPAPARRGRSTSTCTRATAPPGSSATTRASSRCRCTARRTFPFRKEASDLDVDLPDGCGDDEYLQALEQPWRNWSAASIPGLVIYLAGADPHEGDRLGRLKLTWDGLEARDRRVFDWAWQRGIPLAFAMAGGYGHRMEDTVQVQVNTFRVAFRVLAPLAESAR
jgi:acetoin utilization deacetylase AcuC-like enzyme